MAEPFLFPEQYAGDLAIDVGSGIGWWTEILSQNFNRVISIEPSHLAIEQQIARLVEVGVTNVEFVIAPCWHRSRLIKLFDYSNSIERTGGVPLLSVARDKAHCAPPRTAIIQPTIVIDDLLPMIGRSQVDFVKVDVEGSEWETLRGAGQLISLHRPKLVVEVHTRAEEIEAVLVNYGYEYEVVNPFPDNPHHFWIKTKGFAE